MTHEDHVKLLKKAVNRPNGVWADIGSGLGAFTLAIADLLGSGGKIYSVDKDPKRLATQRSLMEQRFPAEKVVYLNRDFRDKLFLPQLDGMVMANSLHYIDDKQEILDHLLRYLKTNGKFVLIEYNVEEGNSWVPYPLTLKNFTPLARSVGLSQPELIGSRPSDFLREIYSALAIKK